MRQCLWGIIGCCACLLIATQVALAQSAQLPPLHISMGTTPQAGDLAIPLQILLLLTLLSFIPALLIAMTSFTRIVIVSAIPAEPSSPMITVSAALAFRKHRCENTPDLNDVIFS